MTSRRLSIAAGLGVLLVVATAAPADAHTVTGVQPTNYRSEIIAITPATEDVTIELLDLGNRIRLTNTGPELVVLGYDGEPYLRVGPQGVYENRNSPAVELNKPGASTNTTTTTAPPSTAPNAPSWRKTTDGHTVTWRDRRTRWEGPTPAAVNADKNSDHIVGQWNIELRRDDQLLTVTGRIIWEPPPNAMPWLLGSAALALALAPLGLLRRCGPPLSAAVAVLVATDMIHTIGNSSTGGGSTLAILGRLLLGGFFSVFAWGAGIWAVPSLQRGRDGGLFLAGFAGLAIAVYGGASDVSSLGRSQLAYAWEPTTARAAITVALGAGIGTAIASGLALWRLTPQRATNRD